MNKFLLYGGIAVVILAVSGYVFLGGETETTNGQIGVFTYVDAVKRGDLNLVVSSNGVVDPINKVEIKSKASGRVEDLRFIEGDEVQKGSLLLMLDQRTTKNDVDQAKADLAVAEASLQQAANNYERSRELFGKSLVSEQDRDQSNLEFVRAQAQLVKAKASLSSADERLADTRIVSPISGIVLTKTVELGQIISSGVSNVGGGTLIATLADMDEVFVLTNVDEVDIGKVKVGQPATVIADAYPDVRFNGSVERIAPQGTTQQSVTTFTVVVRVRNRGGILKAGMTSTVDIEIFNQKGVLLVPSEALTDPRTQQGKDLMAEYNLTLPVDSSQAQRQAGPAQGGEGSGEVADAERQRRREEMRARFASMSESEREQMRQRFASAGGGGQGSFGGQRRRSTGQDVNEVKIRMIMAKADGDFKPKFIKIGPSNFDNTVVLEGLEEGEEIQITTISRAKIAQEQFNERIRSRNSLGR